MSVFRFRLCGLSYDWSSNPQNPTLKCVNIIYCERLPLYDAIINSAPDPDAVILTLLQAIKGAATVKDQKDGCHVVEKAVE